MALGSGSYDTVGENILPGTYVSLSEDSGDEVSNVAKREVIGVTVMNMKIRLITSTKLWRKWQKA